MLSNTTYIDSINFRIVNITIEEIISFLNALNKKHRYFNLCYYDKRLLHPIDKEIKQNNRVKSSNTFIVSISDEVNPDYKKNIAFMLTKKRVSGKWKEERDKNDELMDCLVSIRGIHSYKNTLEPYLLTLVKEIALHFKERALINRLDIAIDFRPDTRYIKRLNFDDFKIERKESHYIANPNMHGYSSTVYIEANQREYAYEEIVYDYYGDECLR